MAMTTTRAARRPPNLSLTVDASRPTSNTLVESDAISPSISVNAHSRNVALIVDGLDEDTHLQLSSPDSASSPPALSILHPSSPCTEEISKDLAELNLLRKSVKQNLRLRPIRSACNIRTPNAAAHMSELTLPSALPSATPSVYYTPCETPSSLSSNRFFASLPASAVPPQDRSPRGLDPDALYERLTTSKTRPLLIDTRPVTVYLASHLTNSVNIAVPSLILKRCRKTGSSAFQSLEVLRQFITDERGKTAWDALMGPDGSWDGNMVIYDQEMDAKDKDSLRSASWVLLPAIASLLSHGTVDYLQGGMSTARKHPLLRTLISSASSTPSTSSEGLFRLDTQSSSAHRQTLPELDHASSHSPLPLSSKATVDILLDNTPSPPPSRIGFRKIPQKKMSVPNLRRLDTTSTERLNGHIKLIAVNTNAEPVTPRENRVPVRPSRAATLVIPPTHFALTSSLQLPPSPSFGTPLSPCFPSHLPLPLSPLASPSRTPPPTASHPTTSHSTLLPPASPNIFPLSTPRVPSTLHSAPSTARPDVSGPPSSEEPFPMFTVSTILPNFLYLGPELTLPEHVEELRELGVKRILNIAAECDDDHGLGLRDTFEKYFRIPMRDIVEEENIAQGVREVCEILDDARLHSAPTYVHCKAGKSRSVTAVMAYLIHANHWTLSQAYAFVLERRKGISPNIGFVSELMTFEEAELGGKSVGVQPNMTPTGTTAEPHGDTQHHYHHHHHHHLHGHHHHHHDATSKQGNYSVAAGNRRPAHIRESLPPAFQLPDNYAPGPPMSAGGVASIGDLGQEMEIKDANGRYRHARRAPVDETTLQPLRRVSKAGLESAVYLAGLGQ